MSHFIPISPTSEINPQGRIGLIDRDNLDGITGRVAAMDMEGTPCVRSPGDQTTGAVFVTGIILYDFPGGYGLTDLFNGYVAKDACIECMLGELKPVFQEGLTNRVNHVSSDLVRTADGHRDNNTKPSTPLAWALPDTAQYG